MPTNDPFLIDLRTTASRPRTVTVAEFIAIAMESTWSLEPTDQIDLTEGHNPEILVTE